MIFEVMFYSGKNIVLIYRCETLEGRFWFHPNAANATRNIMDLNLPYEENADKKKKRKRRKHRKIKGE